MEKKILLVIIAFLCVLSSYLFYSNMRVKAENVNLIIENSLIPSEEDTHTETQTETPEETQEYVTVYICGEVVSPDVYTLPKGSRVMDAIDIAGGTTGDAWLEIMESAAKQLSDGQKIYVPNINDDIDKINYMNNNISNSVAASKNPDAVVNINTAGVDQLCQVPGIGEATAKLIIDFREENGGFKIIDDIKNVPRIGDKTFESIKKNITVE